MRAAAPHDSMTPPLPPSGQEFPSRAMAGARDRRTGMAQYGAAGPAGTSGTLPLLLEEEGPRHESLAHDAGLLPAAVPIGHGAGGAELDERDEPQDQGQARVQVEQEHQPVCGRGLNRKLDAALLPLLSLLYLFNGLDRANVGNAQTQGEW